VHLRRLPQAGAEEASAGLEAAARKERMNERTQFSGSAMQVTPHFHSLVPDGVLVPQEGDVRFAALPPPWQAHSLQQRLRWTEMDVQRPLPDGTPHLLFTGLELL